MIYFLVSLCAAFNTTFIPSTKTPPSQRFYQLMDYSKLRNSIILFGGAGGPIYYNDLWEFSLNTSEWIEYFPLSEQNPLSRINFGGFASRLSQKFYVFGGSTRLGPDKDIWVFDFEYLYWEKISTYQTPKPRSFFGFTSYLEDGIEYFVVQGGITTEERTNSIYRYVLYRLNMSSLTWEYFKGDGDAPLPTEGSFLEYYNGDLYVSGGHNGNYPSCLPHLYKYSLKNQYWEVISNIENTIECLSFSTSFIYKDEYYLAFGLYTDYFVDSSHIMKINLLDEVKNWTLVLNDTSLERDSQGAVVIENILYIFGGYKVKDGSKSNDFITINLDTIEISEINSDILVPKPRYGHSMHLINSEIYLFGGRNWDKLYNDVWIFNPDTTQWRQIRAKGNIPTPRNFHAADGKGDAIIIWGGEDSSGLKDDMYIFNVITSTWTQLNPLSLINPSAGKGACLVYSTLMVYIYGGSTISDNSNNLWQYEMGANHFTLLSSSLRASIYSTCHLIDEKFFVAFGSLNEDEPSLFIDYYDFKTSKWVEFHYHENVDHDSAMSVQVMMNNKVIRIGGQNYMITPKRNIDILGEGNELIVLNSTLTADCYASGFAYFKKSVYIFGGGSSLGLNLRADVASSLMIKISLEEVCQDGACDALCSPGTYEENGTCIICKPGSYSEGFGNTKCIECEAGTYSSSYGATFNRQCLPCPDGKFAPHIGSSFCVDCPSMYSCPVGSKNPKLPKNYTTNLSVQPSLYTQPNFESTLNYFQFIVGLTLGLTLLAILSIKRTRDKIDKIDMFKDKHNTKLNQFLVLKQTKIGGCFTVLFFITAIILIGSTFINFSLGNVQESKGLVPLVVLEGEVDSFEASEILIIVSFNLYGGECSKESKCLPEIIINKYNIKCQKFEKTCEKSENNGCMIKMVCLNGEILNGAYLTLELTEKLSYSSTIEVNISSSSSVPDEISSMFTAILPESNKVFIGPIASEFFYIATPSLFKSDSIIWPSKETGYHFSSGTTTLVGSQYKPEDLPTVSYLRLSIYIEISTTALLTTRYLKQNVLFLLSSILGSVFGLMGTFGWIMKSFETQVNKYKEKKEGKLKSMKTIYIKRKDLSREMKHFYKSCPWIEFEIPEKIMLKNTFYF